MNALMPGQEEGNSQHDKPPCHDPYGFPLPQAFHGHTIHRAVYHEEIKHEEPASCHIGTAVEKTADAWKQRHEQTQEPHQRTCALRSGTEYQNRQQHQKNPRKNQPGVAFKLTSRQERIQQAPVSMRRIQNWKICVLPCFCRNIE